MAKKALSLTAVALLILAQSLGSGLNAQEAPSLRLIVLVVIDQFRGDVLHRFGRILGPGGFRRMSEQGVWYQNAYYTHGHTVTGVGHATIGTGARPAGHGIPSNDWYDRKNSKSVNCVGDGNSPIIGTAGETGNASPANLTATTFADEWNLATVGRSRAFGVSGKDRGAILPIGKTGKAFWFNTGSGRMVSSTFYYKDLPGWVKDYHKTPPVNKYFGLDWVRTTRDDDGVATAPDDRSIEKDIHGMKRTFPHPLGRDMKAPEGKFYEQVFASIFGDELVMDFALELMRAENLGRRDVLDILNISLSSNDSIGHNFGPDSVEIKEETLGLDRQITKLLKTLDERIGTDRYLVVLTSDHGVAYSPEVVSGKNFSASRYDSGDILKRINRRLDFTVRSLDWSLGFSGPGYFFDPEALIYGGRPVPELENIVADVIRDTPGIAAVYTRTDILADRLPDNEISRKVRAAFHPLRSPDVYVVAQPYWLDGSGTASHGTPYNYDSHVPLLFYGAGLKPEAVMQKVDIMDIAPTITSILRCTTPSASAGNPLLEIINGIQGRALRFFRREAF